MTSHVETAAPPVLTTTEIGAERRRGRIAGGFGIAALACAIGAIVISGRAARHEQSGGELVRQLRSLQTDYSTYHLALAVRLAGLGLTVWVGLFLARAISDRARDAPRALRVLGVAAPAAAGVGLTAGLIGLHQVSVGFTGVGEHAAESLVKHDTFMRVVAVWEIGAHIVFGVWVSLLCVWAMRVGLLPRFLAVWGMGAGVGGVLLPVGDALFLGWLGSVAILLLGLWPEGRPPAWDAGRAISWAEVDRERGREWRLNAPGAPDDR